MPSQHLFPTTSTRLAARTNNLMALLWQVNAEFEFIRAVADQVAQGGDWTSLATEFGFANAGDAETFYNLIVAAQAYFQSVTPGPNAVLTMMERMG